MLRYLLLAAGLVVAVAADEPKCTPEVCKQPTCYCRNSQFPFNKTGIQSKEDVPQFVMLTFDDAVSESNMEFYKELLGTSRKNPGRACPIRATFFVAHEYTNYAYVNELYLKGCEIASHSVSHTSLTDKWRTMDEKGWRAEMEGLREIAEKFGLIPKEKIVGTRAPFLQTSGDALFRMLKNNKFLYDSSMPTQDYTSPPIWPYTLDYGFDQDCIIDPCPTGRFPGIWEVPLIMLYKLREVIPGNPEEYPCAMADACIPLPVTAKETEEYLYKNFLRHYQSNKAPFPVFIHESWLKDSGRRAGYLNFVNNMKKHTDVYFVTIQEIIDYMKNPIPLKDYRSKECPKVTGGEGCVRRACNFQVGPEAWQTRRMDSCITCPKKNEYPGRELINVT